MLSHGLFLSLLYIGQERRELNRQSIDGRGRGQSDKSEENEQGQNADKRAHDLAFLRSMRVIHVSRAILETDRQRHITTDAQV